MKQKSLGFTVITFAIAGFLGWMYFRPPPTPADFQTVSGVIASSTATCNRGSNEFTVRIWLNGQPDVAYQPAVHVPGQLLGRGEIVPGARVTMEALKKEIEKPCRGLLGNVSTIETCSLTVGNTPISSWKDYQSYQQGQKKCLIFLALGCVVLGVCGGGKRCD